MPAQGPKRLSQGKWPLSWPGRLDGSQPSNMNEGNITEDCMCKMHSAGLEIVSSSV